VSHYSGIKTAWSESFSMQMWRPEDGASKYIESAHMKFRINNIG